jgi:glycine oxidase
MRVAVLGAGVAGLTCATCLAERGAEVEVFERASSLGATACSWLAGGMLAPGCEGESAPPVVVTLGQESLPWWRARVPTVAAGSLVLAHGRDTGDLKHFARRTAGHQWLDAAAIAQLEPALAGRFGLGLLFPEEGHLEPRQALTALLTRLQGLRVPVHFGMEVRSADFPGCQVIDCRGLAARDTLTDLRGVKGEMLVLEQPEVSLSRPVRVLHPRIPVYVVPRPGGRCMVGATMIESDAQSRISARSMLELLSAVYALHPAFGAGEIVEIGTGVRPAFPDNVPRIRRIGSTLYVNGLYRHGFLMAPALASRVAQVLLEGRFFPEVMEMEHENSRERRLA